MITGHADTVQDNAREGKPMFALVRQKTGRRWNPPDKNPTVLFTSEDEGAVCRFLDDDIEDMTAKCPELANYRLYEGDSRYLYVTIGDDPKLKVVYTLFKSQEGGKE